MLRSYTIELGGNYILKDYKLIRPSYEDIDIFFMDNDRDFIQIDVRDDSVESIEIEFMFATTSDPEIVNIRRETFDLKSEDEWYKDKMEQPTRWHHKPTDSEVLTAPVIWNPVDIEILLELAAEIEDMFFDAMDQEIEKENQDKDDQV